MQGADIKGFAIWSVNRDLKSEGPFKYYKNMIGNNKKSNVRQVCESNVRHHIANTELETLLTDRETLKAKVTKDLKISLAGWGIWLESVEITEVRICSKTVFEDLQAVYRSEEELKALKTNLVTKNQIRLSQAESDFETQKQAETIET